MLPLAPQEIPLTFLLGSKDCLSQGWFIYFLQFPVSGQDCSVGWPRKVMVLFSWEAHGQGVGWWYHKTIGKNKMIDVAL